MESWFKIGFVAVGVGAIFLLSRYLSAKEKGVSKVVALGDSLTANGRYCRELESLMPGSLVRCVGYEGTGTAEIARHVSDALYGSPSHVIILAGVNDLASGRPLVNIKDNLYGMYKLAKVSGAHVIAVGLTPWAGHAKGRNLEAETKNLNEWIRGAIYVDRFVDTLDLGDESGRLLPEFDSGDGLHLNAAGQIALGRLIFNQVWR